MATLKKATLQEISADAGARPIGDPIEVQFNPASLKLDLANKVEGGDSRGRQKRQYLGKTSTTLSFDLHFDTADQGTTDEPVSVRRLTAQVERFVLPKGSGNTKQSPPKCRFHWDELVIDGIIESVSLDFELFASNGTPLRAKVTVAIKEQDAKYELLQAGPGANQMSNATEPGATGTGPGSTGGPPPDSSAPALDGESAADFAARMGLDPTAWRGIAANLGGGSSLSLQAGVSVDFSASLSAGVGIGVSAGVEANASVSVAAAFGVDASASASAGAGAGFAIAAAGGVAAAIETVASVTAGQAADTERRAFASALPAGGGAVMPPPSSSPKPALPDQPRTPLQLAGAGAAPDTSAPPPPTADPRAVSFGRGVPLRPRAGGAADLRTAAAIGRIPLRPRSHASNAPVTNDPSVPPWMRLPSGAVRIASDAAQRDQYPSRPCGCAGGVNPGGKRCR
jgi:hypothetical protein